MKPDELSQAAFDLADLRTRIEAASPTQAGAFYDLLTAFSRAADEFVALGKQALIERLDGGQDVLVQTERGPRRLYLAIDRRTSCNNVRATLEAVLSESGDLAAVAGCLASNAFKPGACKQVLGAEWVNHFTVDERTKLAEGSVKKSLRLARDAEEVDDGD